MQTGLGIWATWPVGWRGPVWGWMRKVTMVSVSWLAARSQLPEGSMAKLRGVWPRVDSLPRLVRRPVAWSMANMAMLSWPRLEP